MASPSFDDRGLIPAIAQDRLTGELRMVAWMNREALEQTLSTGRATFFSRSRRSLWQKGETSGNALAVHAVVADCDADVLLLLVDPEGPSCHTGAPSCFHRRLVGGEVVDEPSTAGPFLLELEATIAARRSSTAERSYTRSLLDGGAARIGAKLREEAEELARALESESDDRVAAEAADLVFHVLVGLAQRGVGWRAVLGVLAGRHGTSGHAEKAGRTRSG
ncbi:MAG: bifunctional phosphoribosyl-AMP cyclohydrolase/phosphoribosyl-ATP diphosphatase HisIE [Polyangiaceae bacterium]|nr:bifunctional phosphoribosyl-AMP cyclohydrolase/phosphoribosyl-ATP diphosphatase HisIE [Polyangiaceae bacterium]